MYTACHMQCTYILGADGKAQNTAILDQGLPVLTRVVHSIKIGQYPQHMTLCPPVSIVKRWHRLEEFLTTEHDTVTLHLLTIDTTKSTTTRRFPTAVTLIPALIAKATDEAHKPVRLTTR